jgi:hypothetical protein
MFCIMTDWVLREMGEGMENLANTQPRQDGGLCFLDLITKGMNLSTEHVVASFQQYQQESGEDEQQYSPLQALWRDVDAFCEILVESGVKEAFEAFHSVGSTSNSSGSGSVGSMGATNGLGRKNSANGSTRSSLLGSSSKFPAMEKALDIFRQEFASMIGDVNSML